MPEAAAAWLEKQDIALTQRFLQNLLDAYLLDFSEYADNRMVPKIGCVRRSIPSQLARENKEFLCQTVRTGAKARSMKTRSSGLQRPVWYSRFFASSNPPCRFRRMTTSVRSNYFCAITFLVLSNIVWVS